MYGRLILPLAKLHVPAEMNPQACQALAQDAREAIIRALEVQPIRVKAIVYTSPGHCRAVHPERDPGFVVAEVLFFEGRPRELKDRLLAELAQVILRHTGLTPENVFINIQESQRQNWGLMGGEPGDQVDLGY
jgi:phenylpyruvate tautomerase PptA (4-oxalocrotonate tautomerase family)